MKSERYPKIAIRSKTEFSRRISHKKFDRDSSLALVNSVLQNLDSLWRDNLPLSEPEKGKYVRNAKYTDLGKLLKMINVRILKPHDKLLPPFLFGGISGRDHVQAAKNLIGHKKYRGLLKLDIQRFFEQVSYDRVFQFFYVKAGCSKKAAHMLARLCCVPKGPKGSQSDELVLARGFATSSRLAVWCNLDFFIKLEWLVKKELKGKDPRLSVYVDDIGITASKVTEQEMDHLYSKIEDLFENTDKNQSLPLHPKKKKILHHSQGLRILGTKIMRNGLVISDKTSSKIHRINKKIVRAKHREERSSYKRIKNHLMMYKKYVEKS